MTDGTVRSLNGYYGYDSGDTYEFAFSPSPLPHDVTSPDEIEFQWLDADQPTLPSINSTVEVADFRVEGGLALYEIVIYADGVRLSLPGELTAGGTSPYSLSKG